MTTIVDVARIMLEKRREAEALLAEGDEGYGATLAACDADIAQDEVIRRLRTTVGDYFND